MKLKKSEVIMLCFLAVLIGACAYYFFYFRPNTELTEQLQVSIEEKKQELYEAKLRSVQWNILNTQKDDLEIDWTRTVKNLPQRFDNANVLSMIQRIIAPYTKDIGIKFAGQAKTFGSASIHAVDISFSVSYTELQKLLSDFENESTYNRIINLSSSNISGTNSGTALQVSMTIEFLIR